LRVPETTDSRQQSDVRNAVGVQSTRSRYAINRRASRFSIRVSATGVLWAFGHNPTIAVRDFAGEVQINPEKIEDSRVRISVKAASLSVMDDISDKDRREIERQMYEDVLEVTKCPEIVYECADLSAHSTGNGQYRVTLNGELTLHGVCRRQPTSAQATLSRETLVAFGEFALLQSDYGIRLVSALGGALKVKDEVKCSFHIVASRLE
jgi:polyisoprenoid-binding protein YceI